MTANKTQQALCIAAALCVLGGLLASPALASKNVIFELTDPRGDDHGDGTMIYPSRTDFGAGELDLVKLTARQVSGGTEFEATFARPIRSPGEETIDDLGTQLADIARHGFYNFNIDIYIDTDREFASGAVAMMPGREAEVRVDDAWDRAIIVTPMPYEAKSSLTRQIVKAMSKEARYQYEETGRPFEQREVKRTVSGDMADRVYFPTRMRVRGRKISFFVPSSFLRGPAQSDWSYVVAVSGADLIQRFDLSARAGLATSTRDRLMIVPVSSGAWQSRFGTARTDTELQPPLVDILVPEGFTQEGVLEDFSSRHGRPAVLPGLIPSELDKKDDLTGAP